MKSPRNSAQQDKVKPGANGVFRHGSRKQTRARTGAFEINTQSLGGGGDVKKTENVSTTTSTPGFREF